MFFSIDGVSSKEFSAGSKQEKPTLIRGDMVLHNCGGREINLPCEAYLLRTQYSAYKRFCWYYIPITLEVVSPFPSLCHCLWIAIKTAFFPQWNESSVVIKSSFHYVYFYYGIHYFIIIYLGSSLYHGIWSSGELYQDLSIFTHLLTLPSTSSP